MSKSNHHPTMGAADATARSAEQARAANIAYQQNIERQKNNSDLVRPTRATDWDEVLNATNAIRRVTLFSEYMAPGQFAIVEKGGRNMSVSAINAYDLRVVARRASTATVRAWIYFGIGLASGFAAGAAVIVASFHVAR
jgi:hypothetical protein